MTTQPAAPAVLDLRPIPDSPPAPAWVLIFAVLGGPAAWTIHLFFSYFLVTWHLGLDGFGIRAIMLIVTAILAGVAALAAIASITAWRHTADRDRSLDEPTSRSGFLA